jgi:hypothetical protein
MALQAARVQCTLETEATRLEAREAGAAVGLGDAFHLQASGK